MKKLLWVLLLIATPAFADYTETVVVIEDKVNGIDFRDAIRYADEAEMAAKVNDGSFGVERQKRLDGFKNAMDNPVKPVPPTKEQLLAEQQDIIQQKANLDARATEITAEVQAIDAKVDVTPVEEVVVK